MRTHHFKTADRSDVFSCIERSPMTKYLKRLVLFSSGGAFLDGYVISLVGVALTQITPQLGLSQAQSAEIGAASLVGILFGSLFGGMLTDALGRRTMFIVDLIAIAVCSLVSMCAGDAFQIMMCRFLIGVFIGADYPIATSLITEFTPQSKRAIAMGIVAASWYFGATVAAFVGYALYAVDDGWKWMLGSAIIPCIVLLIGRHDIPESPRWLRNKGRSAEALAILEKVYGSHYDAVPAEHVSSDKPIHVFTKGYRSRTVFLGILILCQVVPMYAVYTFGPEIMTAFGLNNGHESILGEAVVSVMFLIGGIPAMFWLNSLGRRKLLLLGLALMIVGLLALGLWPTAPLWYVFAGFGVYAFFSGGPGILQWLYPNELFPTDVRATAVGVAIAFSRIGVAVSIYGLPLFMESYGVGATMLVAAALVGIGFVWSLVCAPETKRLTLHEASSLQHKHANK